VGVDQVVKKMKHSYSGYIKSTVSILRTLGFLSLFISVSAFKLSTQAPEPFKIGEWEQAQLQQMSLEQKIAQLMMIEVRPRLGETHINQVRSLVEQYQVGGLIFFKGEPLKQLELTNELQAKSKVPMLIAIDGEWGLSMRLSNTPEYPYQLALGAIQKEDLIYDMGRDIGRQCRRMGIHVNFAPVADINNNPNNPVINFRSFGENKKNVARKAWMYAKGMQYERIIACAKHFPGHGDTEVDSHKDLPIIEHNRYHLDSFELYPFRYMFDRGIKSVMSAHLYIPAIDPTPNQATSVSEKSINELLRKDMGYQGLVFTDALSMKGVSKYYESGALELQALQAGNDILLGPADVEAALNRIKNAIENGEYSQEELDKKVLKVLAAKRWCGLDKYHPASAKNLNAELNTSHSKKLISRLISESLCLIKDEKNQVPFQSKSMKTALLAIGSLQPTPFQKHMGMYVHADMIQCPSDPDANKQIELIDELKGYERIIISLHGLSKYQHRGYGITTGMKQLVSTLSQSNNVSLVLFGNPYALSDFPEPGTLLLAYDEDILYQKNAAMALCGVKDIHGKLSVSTGVYKTGAGLKKEKKTKLGFSAFEDKDLRSLNTHKIDSIVARAIDIKACPGAQILIAKDAEVVYQASYGKHTYETNAEAVRDDHLFDLASITKIGATTLAVMKLYEEGKIQLHARLSDYIPELRNSNKKHITVSQVLSHTSGLKGWIPFYLRMKKNPEDALFYYASAQNLVYPFEAGPSIYLNKSLPDSVFKWIIESPVKPSGKYVYSDLGMILLAKAIEHISGMSFERYLQSEFYEPMGLSTLTFKPLERFDPNKIIPTEHGIDFRNELIHGYVHDPAAAMMGGVSGHAGLFSNAFDLAQIMQMLLNGGYYNGKQFLKKSTIEQFTKRHNPEYRRGLGFDKPETNQHLPNPASDMAPAACFGHTGFTGTMVWADPKNELIYVFLSNRIHPTADNRKLISENIRTSIMDVIYESLTNP
jgi:beta-N-acetylhexosaminidase